MKKHPPKALLRSLSAGFLLLAAFSLAALPPSPGNALETLAAQAILIDDETGTVIFEKNADLPVAPASMSKLMTLYLIFERLQAGQLSLEDSFRVSEKAWRMGGSKTFVEVGSKVSVEDLVRGVTVQSGNDASIVLAEGVSGSEEAFAAEMMERGRELGLTGSDFKNATGWPDEGHVMTMRDIAILTHRLIHDFPEYYHYFSETTFTYNDIRQGNRNPLLYKDLGVDGLKTGHVQAAGYGLAASAERDGRRLILAIHGLKSVDERSKEAERLFDHGYREFGNYALFEAGELVSEAEVWLGDQPTVPLVIEQALLITLERKARQYLEVSVVYESPIPAPIEKGRQIARLLVNAPDLEGLEIPLVAGAEVEGLSAFPRLEAAINYLLWGPDEP